MKVNASQASGVGAGKEILLISAEKREQEGDLLVWYWKENASKVIGFESLREAPWWSRSRVIGSTALTLKQLKW